MSVSWEAECHVLYEDIKKQTLIIKEQQEEINRLTIAYQNASDQRQHYVEKCLMLSEVVLDLGHSLDFYQQSLCFGESEFMSDNVTDYVARCAIVKHKDLIEELERNLCDSKKRGC